jgi:hypothetical protein
MIMHRWIRTFAVILSWVAALGSVQAFNVAHAQGITFDSENVTYKFAESLAFTLSASGDVPITQATVFYQTGNARPFSQPAAQFTPAQQVNVAATIVFSETRPPAFSTIAYWWEIVDQSGNQQRSEVKTFTYIDNRFSWQDLTAGITRVHWYQGNSSFGAAAAAMANDNLARLHQQLGIEPPSTIDFYIYNSLVDLRSAVELAGRPWLSGQARPELGVVMVAIPPGDSARIQMERDIPHELTHLMVYLASGPGYDAVPAWLDEGLATMNEGDPNPTQAVALQDALAQNRVPALDTLCGAFPTDASAALVAYAVSRGITQEIIDEYGSTGVQSLLAAYADGASCGGGVERALNTTLAGLELKWRSSFGPANGVATIAQGSGPWLLIWLVIALPFAALLLSRKPKKNS